MLERDAIFRSGVLSLHGARQAIEEPSPEPPTDKETTSSEPCAPIVNYHFIPTILITTRIVNVETFSFLPDTGANAVECHNFVPEWHL